MEKKQILMPNGKVFTYYRDKDQTWAEIIESHILPYWQDYCNANWISPNHEEVYSPERRVKSLLDRLGFLLTMRSEDVESEYKAMTHKVREIPVTECSSFINDMFYSEGEPPLYDDSERYKLLTEKLDQLVENRRKKKPLPHRETRFDRLTKIERSFPDSKRTWCIVDANNHFTYNGIEYTVPEEMQGYIDDTQDKVLMDRILVVESENALRFYDQNVQNMFILV